MKTLRVSATPSPSASRSKVMRLALGAPQALITVNGAAAAAAARMKRMVDMPELLSPQRHGKKHSGTRAAAWLSAGCPAVCRSRPTAGRSGQRLHRRQQGRDQLADGRVNVHAALDHRVGRAGGHHVEQRMNDLVALDA